MADLDHRAVLFSASARAWVSGEEPARRRAVEERLSQHSRNLVPRRGQSSDRRGSHLPDDGRGGACNGGRSRQTGRHSGADRRLSAPAEPAVASRHGNDRLLSELPWRETAPTVERLSGRAEPTDEVSVSRAAAGVAESGTLILLSGPTIRRR